MWLQTWQINVFFTGGMSDFWSGDNWSHGPWHAKLGSRTLVTISVLVSEAHVLLLASTTASQ